MDANFIDDPAFGSLTQSFWDVFGGRSLPCLLFSDAGTCLAANDAYVRLLGGTPGCVMPGQRLRDIVPGDVAADIPFVLQSARVADAESAALSFKLLNGPEEYRRQEFHFFAFDHGGDMAGLAAHVVATADFEATLASAQTQMSKLTQSERMMRASIESSRLALWNVCPETGETWFSDLWFEMLGYKAGAFEPSIDAWLTLVHPEDRAAALGAFSEVVQGASDYYQADFRVKRADGAWQWLGASGARVDRESTNEPYLVCGTQADITQRKLSEAQLEETAAAATEHRNRLDRLADNAPVGLFEFRIDAEGTTLLPYASQSVLDTLGVTRADAEADGASVFRNILPKYHDEMGEAIGVSMRDLSPFKIRYEVDHPTKGIRWVKANSLPVRLDDGGTTWYGALYDVSDEVAREAALQNARDQALDMQQQMEVLAMQDALTGLPNRRRYEQILAERQRAGNADHLTLIRVDLDHFKYVNDNLGHDAGDAVLCHVAKTLLASVAPEDHVFRVGGDEFSILLGPGGNEEMAEETVMHIQGALTAPFLFDGQVCRFGASFGVAVRSSKADVSDDELNTFADVALYEAKARGRNRVEVFTADLHRHLIENRKLAVELEEALERREFQPHFQPQICAQTSALVGFETLARWQHPTRGVLAPGIFMEVAEQLRMVPLMDQMILDKTRGVIGDWRARGFVPPKVSFNVSSGQLQDRAILDMAKNLLSESVKISFELLESILVEEESDMFRHNLDALKDMGIQIEIDDFGSGHASILGLMQTDPAVLKIDKRLIKHVEESQQTQHMITAVVGMARALGISTTAEGVETQGQAEMLRDLGCDTLQGFLFSKPLDPQKAFEFATQWRSVAA